MSQSVWSSINPATTSGTQLSVLLNDFKNAVMSGLSGTSRPSQTTAGGSWIDTTNGGSPNFYWSYKIYDGTTDIEVFRVNLATGKASISGSDSEFEVSKISADAAGPLLKFVKQRIASSGQVNSGDTIGEVRFVGRASDASNPVVASIKVIAQENQTASAAGSYLSFSSTPAGVASAAEFMRIFDSKLGIGTQAPETKVHAVSATGIKSEASSDDAVGGKLIVEKSRVAGTGAVQTSDVIGQVDYSAKDSTGAKSVVASAQVTATEGHTGTNKGSLFKLFTTDTGGATLVEKMSIGTSGIESVAAHKLNALELASQAVATTATINQLSATKTVVEFTGSTATSLRGLNSSHASKTVLLHNISTADITLEHENSGATAADRFKLPGSAPLIIGSQKSVEVFYSSTDSRWKLKSTATDTAGTAQLAVTSKTSAYTAVTTDDVILASGAAFTITLYAAAGNTGKTIRIKKTDASLTNVITIDGNGSETIDGSLTTTINTQFEQVTLISNGSSWELVSRTYPSAFVSYAPTITGFGTPSTVEFYSRRVGDCLEVKGTFTSGISTATQAQITLGYGGTNANVTSAGAAAIGSLGNVVGSGFISQAGAFSYATIALRSVGYVGFGLAATGVAGFTLQNGNTLAANGNLFSFHGMIPINGWK